MKQALTFTPPILSSTESKLNVEAFDASVEAFENHEYLKSFYALGRWDENPVPEENQWRCTDGFCYCERQCTHPLPDIRFCQPGTGWYRLIFGYTDPKAR